MEEFERVYLQAKAEGDREAIRDLMGITAIGIVLFEENADGDDRADIEAARTRVKAWAVEEEARKTENAPMTASEARTEIAECWLALIAATRERQGGRPVTQSEIDKVTAYVIALFDGKPNKTASEMEQVGGLRAVLEDSLSTERERIWA